MARDIIIRGGRIVDGLLGPEYVGDVAIDGDTITALGEVDGRGKREIGTTQPRSAGFLSGLSTNVLLRHSGIRRAHRGAWREHMRNQPPH